MNNQNIYSIAGLGDDIFAGTIGSIYHSTNNGTSWTQTGTTAFYNHAVTSLAAYGDNMLAGTNTYANSGGVYISTNAGTNWARTVLNYCDVLTLATFGMNIFAGTADSGIYLSTNFGANWTCKNQGFNGIPQINALLITNNYIFAGTTGYSVWRRTISDITSINNMSMEIQDAYSLSQNYPNPFNPVTRISFQLPVAGNASLMIFDMLGKEIVTLVNETLNAGTYTVDWNASEFPSGVYFYRLTAEGYGETKRMTLIK
ncbi:MAG: T9SS type A sorting domain-containing protein [Ignavibacteriae bacterium]|nr:T9SS type A sorting domain-containing protein [Ignavibacteriota bacterium]